MDAKTVLLTANTETVYAHQPSRLKADGPTVVEAPPQMLGFIQDGLQRYLSDIGPLGPDKGEGGKFLVLPPGLRRGCPRRIFRGAVADLLGDVRRARLPGRRQHRSGRRVDEADQGLSAGQGGRRRRRWSSSTAPARTSTRCSPTTSTSSSCWRCSSTRSRPRFSDRWNARMMQAIGIEKGKPFKPDDEDQSDAGGSGTAGRSDGSRQHLRLIRSGCLLLSRPQVAGRAGGHDATRSRKDGVPQIDARNIVYYMAAGNSPAMMEKNVGQGSQYLWTYRDADGNFLDGAKNYRLHVPPDIPIKNFWSVVVYDALSRSELQNGQPFPVGQRLHRSRDQRRRLGRHPLWSRTAQR